ncbi:MAG: hypothetical protein MUO82_04470 [Candidatus Thermoplasmatota archaeon]|nr:hypothetical protein [Candidatus Thermoplasmatota archaeon]
MLESVAVQSPASSLTRRKLLNNSNKIDVFDLRNGFEHKNSPYNVVALGGFQSVNSDLFQHKDMMKYDKSGRFGYYSDWINSALFKYAESQFLKYIDFSSNRFIVFNNKLSNEHVVGFLENRFSSSYMKKIEKRIRWLCFNYGNKKCVLLTLTFDPKIWFNDKYDMWVSAKKELNRFLSGIRRYFDYHDLVMPDYFCSIEAIRGIPDNDFIGKGLPHFHILFFNCCRLLDWRKIEKLWKNGYIWINRTSDGKKIRKPIDYVAKYITKTFCRSDNDNVLVQSLCWLFGIRSYSCSRGLGLYPINSPFSFEVWEPEYLISCTGNHDESDLKNIFRLLGAG